MKTHETLIKYTCCKKLIHFLGFFSVKAETVQMCIYYSQFSANPQNCVFANLIIPRIRSACETDICVLMMRVSCCGSQKLGNFDPYSIAFWSFIKIYACSGICFWSL